MNFRVNVRFAKQGRGNDVKTEHPNRMVIITTFVPIRSGIFTRKVKTPSPLNKWKGVSILQRPHDRSFVAVSLERYGNLIGSWESIGQQRSGGELNTHWANPKRQSTRPCLIFRPPADLKKTS